jgi:hypothetical protein
MSLGTSCSQFGTPVSYSQYSAPSSGSRYSSLFTPLAIAHIHKQACNQYKHTNLPAELEEGINGKRRNIYMIYEELVNGSTGIILGKVW